MIAARNENSGKNHGMTSHRGVIESRADAEKLDNNSTDVISWGNESGNATVEVDVVSYLMNLNEKLSTKSTSRPSETSCCVIRINMILAVAVISCITVSFVVQRFLIKLSCNFQSNK